MAGLEESSGAAGQVAILAWGFKGRLYEGGMSS